MCHTLTPLVMHSSRRKVLQCSCGVRHIIWENLNLSVQDDEFRDLCQLVQSDTLDTVGQWHLHRGAGGIGLWYGAFGTTFSHGEFADFVLLLQAVLTLPVTPPRPLYALN
ncbi:hypothetical protein Dxin01_03797 [Deinococcus xinjiangensis]|uniref:Uncharacterized protein n=2 Tax=Deinococcus TaxID=1298 RepID=A0ABP9VFM8_9DEIO